MRQFVRLLKKAIELEGKAEENHKDCINSCNCHNIHEDQRRVLKDLDIEFEVEVRVCLGRIN